MALSPADEQKLSDYLHGIKDRPEPLARFGQGVANILPETLTGFLQLGQNIADPLRASDTPTPSVPNFFTLPESASTGEDIADVAKGFVHAGAMFAAPELLGVRSAAARMALGNAALTSTSDPTVEGVGTSALAGLALGPTSKLPFLQRLATGAEVGILHTGITGKDQMLNDMMLNLIGGHESKRIVPGSKPIENLGPLSDAYLHADEGIVPTEVKPNAEALRQQA
jgi:hypothetical protein